MCIRDRPTQVNFGQSVENTSGANNFNETITYTFQAPSSSFAISTPDQTFTIFNDVLQVDVESIRIDATFPDVDRSTAYFARGMGAIGFVDRDCITDGVIRDSSTDCDEVNEFYSVRVN